jgi:hypothetical protein
MSIKPASPDRRQFGRRETMLHAWIKVPGRPPLPCTVRDLSVGGALIECESAEVLPFSFELVIEATRFRTHCEVRHAKPGSVGVRFYNRPADRRSTTPTRGYATRPRADDVAEWMG